MNQQVDMYFEEGCGRCKLYKTPQCKVHNWVPLLKSLRAIALSCGLTEEIKWSFPVYTFNGKNIMMLTAFKAYAAISFFKGSLLEDEKKILQQNGENAQAFKLLKFTEVKQIANQSDIIKSFIYQAIELEKAGKKIIFQKNKEPMPVELEEKLAKDAKLKKAFFALTPGRQRGYILFFSQAKQSNTRERRIESCVSKILKGEGLHDSYKC